MVKGIAVKANHLRVEISLANRYSNGDDAKALPIGSRSMAFSMTERVWHGFVVLEAEVDPIPPGQRASATIAFINPEAAHAAFPSGSLALIGDGAVSRGTLEILTVTPLTCT